MNHKIRAVFITCLAVAMTSGVSFAGFIRFKKPVAKTPVATTPPSPVSSTPTPSSPVPSAPVNPVIARGTYDFISLGTGGDDAREPGSDGVVTVGENGEISGSLYNYSDASIDTLVGTVNRMTGLGSATTRNNKSGEIVRYTFNGKTTTRQYSFLEGNYQEVESSSKGRFWGIREVD